MVTSRDILTYLYKLRTHLHIFDLFIMCGYINVRLKLAQYDLLTNGNRVEERNGQDIINKTTTYKLVFIQHTSFYQQKNNIYMHSRLLTIQTNHIHILSNSLFP